MMTMRLRQIDQCEMRWSTRGNTSAVAGNLPLYAIAIAPTTPATVFCGKGIARRLRELTT